MNNLTRLLIIGLTVLSYNCFASGHSIFVNDCISMNQKLHKATVDFYDNLDKSSDPSILKPAVQAYVAELMESQNLLLKHTKVENEAIKEVSTDLRNLLTDLTKNTYGYLSSIGKGNLTDEDINELGNDLKMKNDFASGFFREITLGTCATLVIQKPKHKENPEKQYIVLTEQQRNDIVDKLKKDFGKSIMKGTKLESKTPFEYSSRMIYEFLNLDWEFERK